MGFYYNPGNESFRKATSDELYVDKTGLINVLNKLINKEKNCIALSHARRFGKSQAAGMIDAYYSKGSDSRELFSKFEISKSENFEKYLNKYNVIHLDIASFFNSSGENIIEEIRKRILNDIKKEFDNQVNYDNDLSVIFEEIYKLTNTAFVIIIDEWDCIIRNSNNEELVHKYLQFLHTIFKSEESKSFLALAYITGILPIKKIQDESALNNFEEYTMINSDEFTPYFGFTEEEVKMLCEKYDMDFEEVKKWYDGYLINKIHIYNPNSVSEAIYRHAVRSYWKNTSAFSTINNYVCLNYAGLKDDVLKMMNGERVNVNVNKFQNDLSIINSKDDALTALIHLGYLAYDSDTGECFIPNYEVSLAFEAALSDNSWGIIAKTFNNCNRLLNATIRGEEEQVSEMIDIAHEAYSSIYKYNNENTLSCVINMAYFTAQEDYNIIRELPTGKGFADLVFIPRKNKNKPAMIIELKYDKNADTAIKQIKEKRYEGALKDYNKDILLVGINYDKDTKKHECKIEKI